MLLSLKEMHIPRLMNPNHRGREIGHGGREILASFRWLACWHEVASFHVFGTGISFSLIAAPAFPL